MDTFFQVLTTDNYGYPVLQELYTDQDEAKKGMAEFQEMWPGEWWIEEGTQYVKDKCRGCGTPYAMMKYDAYGIQTGNWCEDCYESDKYPYRKDKYPTLETHGYGDRLGLYDEDY